MLDKPNVENVLEIQRAKMEILVGEGKMAEFLVVGVIGVVVIVLVGLMLGRMHLYE